MRIQEEKIEKKYIEEFVWGTSLFFLYALLLMSFLLLFLFTPSLSSTPILRRKKFCFKKWCWWGRRGVVWRLLHPSSTHCLWPCLIKCSILDIWEDFLNIKVLNMSGLTKALNKTFHDRCLIVFWICLRFWICQDSKYTRFTHGSE